jgi:cardiolipin synthase
MIHPGNRLELLEGGAGYFPALIAAIDAATSEVHLESYIYVNDAAGEAIGAALMRAARRGVATRVLLDGFGSRTLDKAFVERLREAGVELLFYRPVSSLWQFRRRRLRRLHRKLAVIDRRSAFVGGINIIDDLDGDDLRAPRLDFAVRIDGPLVAEVHACARSLWNRLAWLRAGRATRMPRLGRSELVQAGRQKAQLVCRDNLRRRRDIEASYLDALRSARLEVFIANAYFLPGRRFRQALVEAARNGARVVLLVQGHTDHRLFHAATRTLYSYFLENGVEIFEYQASELHAKAAVVDGRWATLGSSNIDPFSLLLAREANVVAHDRKFAMEVIAAIESALGDGAERIHRMAWRRLPWWQRAQSWLAYGWVRMLIGLSGQRRAWDGEGG